MTTEAERLAKSLRIKAGCISMGEMIAWGSDSALMDQAAVFVEKQAAEIERLKADLAHTEECCTGWAGDFGKSNALLRQAFDALSKYTTPGVLGGRMPIDSELVAAIKQHLGEV